MITVDIWSDVACPFCYIGKKHFELALERAGLKGQVKYDWRSFQLDPDAPKQDERNIYEILAKKYNQSEDRARAMTSNVISMARNVGLEFNMDALQSTNTFDAHRIIHFAKEHGKQNEMKEAFFKAYFSEGRHIGNSKTIIQIVESVGLDQGEAFKVLDSDKYASDVHEDIRAAQTIGIQGVPFFLINKKYGVSGAQPISNFIQVFEEIISKQKNKVV
jgi:predicted DsbA family dithiol-disulfide isomerase